jgi:divalent metal cation (Fe/Co/Zn/Cd) transporter
MQAESLTRGDAPIAKVKNGAIAGAATAILLTLIQSIFKLKFSTEMETNLSILGVAMLPVIANYAVAYLTKLLPREIKPLALAYNPLTPMSEPHES